MKYNCNKTQKKRLSKSGIAILAKNDHHIEGKIYVKETSLGLTIDYEVKGLSDGLHGFHIHEYGDLSDGCKSACSHFNPFNKKHGGLHSKERHAGDLGNIESKNKLAKGTLHVKGICLTKNMKTSVLGRMFIIHDKEDDLGKGGDEESLKTGNAGARLACGVIGIKK
jgi:Cu-Zn family superoxide dismutase